LRIDRLTRRLVSAPRFVVLGLVALSALISPGFVRVSPESASGLAPASGASSFAARDTAVFELSCREGVFSAHCARLVTELTHALERKSDVFASVRSLANARVVRAERGALRLEPLAATGADSADEPRLLQARVRADQALERRFVSSGERETFVFAELAPGRSASAARATLDPIRAELGNSADFGVTLIGDGPARSASALLVAASLALAALGFGLAPGGARAVALAGPGALALAAFAHALLGLLGDPARTLASFAPELWVASALASSFALIQRSRAEHRRERAPHISVASALAALGPDLACVALLAVVGLASLLALAPGSSRSLALGAAAGMAVALIAYPLGVALAGLVSWPGLLSRARGELASALVRRAEQVLIRPRAVVCGACAILVLGLCLLEALAPASRAVELRTVVLDSGAAGGALEPVFLERVAAYQREAASRPGVLWTSSLVDFALAPANRALHDGDPLFATVPLTRIDVERALEPWHGDAGPTLARALDDRGRRLAVELYVVPGLALGAPIPARSLASSLLSVVCVGLLGAAVLRSARGGLLCAAPALLSATLVLGLAGAFGGGLHGASASLAPLAAALSASLGLQLLVRVRALLELGSQLEVALSLALRDTGPSLASAALASSALIAALGASGSEPAVRVGLACLAPLVAAGSALALLPGSVRALRGRFFAEREPLRADVSALER
jgi:hypothetical protein